MGQSLKSHLATVIHDLITSKLDHFHVCYLDLHLRTVQKLNLVQYALARLP